MTVQILRGDVRAVLPTLADRSVQCCVTSPPYWGLRSYLPDGHPDKVLEIGSESTVDEWVDTMVAVFREVRRVLRDDGVLFLNLGDSYASTGGRGPQMGEQFADRARGQAEICRASRMRPTGDIKTKDLIGQPWMVAFALRADGWWLRQEIIWHKPGPMPESTRDRCTKAHEHIFLLTKSARYFWNFDAVQEPVSGGAHSRGPGNRTHGKHADSLAADLNGEHRTKGGLVAYAERQRAQRLSPKAHSGLARGSHAEGKSARMESATNGDLVDTRNPRSVWTIPAEPFKGSHYATYPTELARRCITAGSRQGDVVLDPFMGSGTTGLACDQLGRGCIGIDLDERNIPMARERVVGGSPLFAEVA